MSTTYSFSRNHAINGHAKDFWRCRHTRCPDPDFHFSIVLGQNWRAVDVPADPPKPGAPSPLAFFRSLDVAGLRGELEVTAFLLPREVAPADWLDAYLMHHGYTVIEREEESTPGGAVAAIRTRTWGERGWIVSQWKTVKDYNRLFLLQARCYESYYYKHADEFAVSLSRFEVMHSGDWPYAERLLSFSRRYPGDFCLFYPESWRLEEDPNNNINGLGVQLINQHGEAELGRICVFTVARPHLDSAQTLVDQFLETLRTNGLNAPPLSLAPSKDIGGFEETWQGKATIRAEGPALEVRVTAGKRPDAWFLIALLGPTRETDIEGWSVNKQAYEILLDRFLTPTEEQLKAAEEAEKAARQNYDSFS